MASPRTQLSVGLPGLPADRLDQVVRRIARESHVRRSTAAGWFDELVKFLDVCASADEPVAPSPRVDKAWHVFILFTRDYRSYCAASHGAFIHHDPMETKDEEAYERAYLAAEARYGFLPRRIWPPPASRSGWGMGGCGGVGCGGGCGGGC
jgi:hypothetical protein